MYTQSHVLMCSDSSSTHECKPTVSHNGLSNDRARKEDHASKDLGPSSVDMQHDVLID